LKRLRDAFGEALVELARDRPDIVVLTADIAWSSRVEQFAVEFPDRFFQVGISEQNMIGVAAGLATTGKTVFATSLAVFVTRRVLDQIAISVAYPRLNVKIMGTLTGLYASKTGATHMALEDIAIMRALPNMMVVVPADEIEVRALLERLVEYEGPVYFRVASVASPDVFDDGHRPELGRAEVVRSGSDITLIGTGIMTARALAAAEDLSKDGIDAAVLHVHTVKPIDGEVISHWAAATGGVVTVENHRIVGGLGSAVAEVLGEHAPVPMRRIGFPDAFGESGSDDELTEKYGLSSRHVAGVARALLQQSREMNGPV
jgi:transketolase